MRPFSFSRAAWVLMAGFGVTHAAAAKKPELGVVEVDLVFPRNQSFAPTQGFPIVFAWQNPEPAKALNMGLAFEIWDETKTLSLTEGFQFDLRRTNLSGTDPHLEYYWSDAFNTEGHWTLVWHVYWHNCTETPDDFWNDGVEINSDHVNRAIEFTISNSAPAIDLVAATDIKDCSEKLGVAIDVTGTLGVPNLATSRGWDGSDTCAVVAPSNPNPDPCRVELDSAATSSMAAVRTARACAFAVSVPDDIVCPPFHKHKNVAPKLAVAGVAGLVAAIGAMGSIMVM